MDKLIHHSFSFDDDWSSLKKYTQARIAIGRTGVSVPTTQMLALKMAHAHARDAVYAELDIARLYEELQQFNVPVLQLYSKATDRRQYLQRPDLGRRLSESSLSYLQGFSKTPADIAIIVADGLSATAINVHAIVLLQYLIPLVKQIGFTLAPICMAEQARVAIADDIGYALHAQLSIILIGERPGLSAADSLGMYLTYRPQPGLTDDARNCISNIRPGGLSFKVAAQKIFYLISEALRRKLSGVDLKDEMGNLTIEL